MSAPILVVDDEPGMRETVVEVLESAGHEAVAAASGDDALDLVREREFSLLVMAIHMPGRDGIEVLRELGPPPPPVILMTAYALDEQIDQASQAQAYALIHKPVPASYLLELVDSARRPHRTDG
jgi:CheY-like chemotaxis protein